MPTVEQMFAMVDTDKNGSISFEELAAFMESIGQCCSREQGQEMFNMVDTNKDGSIDFEEFKALMVEKAKHDSQ